MTAQNPVSFADEVYAGSNALNVMRDYVSRVAGIAVSSLERETLENQIARRNMGPALVTVAFGEIGLGDGTVVPYTWTLTCDDCVPMARLYNCFHRLRTPKTAPCYATNMNPSDIKAIYAEFAYKAVPYLLEAVCRDYGAMWTGGVSLYVNAARALRK